MGTRLWNAGGGGGPDSGQRPATCGLRSVVPRVPFDRGTRELVGPEVEARGVVAVDGVVMGVGVGAGVNSLSPREQPREAALCREAGLVLCSNRGLRG
jgi:hypothetical protein